MVWNLDCDTEKNIIKTLPVIIIIYCFDKQMSHNAMLGLPMREDKYIKSGGDNYNALID